MSASAKEIQADLKRLSNPKDAEFIQWFFKFPEVERQSYLKGTA